ncbi:hypothetical protein E4U32_007339 [Claviceps aff. humidiphila group G2b]|nr:hypothetical protein E4U32_007339 [Claviceps aff. humidiphila group G2b]
MATEGGERLAPAVALNDFAGAESQDAVMVTIRTSSGTEDHWVVEVKLQKITASVPGQSLGSNGLARCSDKLI